MEREDRNVKLISKKNMDFGQEPTYKAIGEFKLEDRCFFIVEEGNNTIGSSATDNVKTGVDVGHVEIEGKHYSIIELKIPVEAECDFTTILTERELEIATLVALGRPNKQIADRLYISEWTVSTHLRRIFVKLGVRNRAAMVYQCRSLIGVVGR